MTGTGALVKLILRRDRIILPVWILLTVMLPIGVANSTSGLYPDASAMQAFADQANGNPAQLATRGLIYAASVGGLTAWTVGSSAMLISGLISLLLVIRHTRVEEENGRRELLGSTVVGRHAPLAAALIVVIGANLVIGVLAALGLTGVGLPAAGSFVLGLSLAFGGIMFAGAAAITTQLSANAATCRVLTFAGGAVFFVLRGVADVGGSSTSWLAWLTPFGWIRLTRAFAGDHWLVFVLMIAFTALLVAVGFALESRRDVASGVLAEKLGPATGTMASPFALAWRLHRNALVGWSVGFLLLGLLLGFAAKGLDAQLDTPQFRAFAEAIGGTGVKLSEAFFAFMIYVLSQLITGVAIIAALRMRTEEVSGRADPLLTAPVSRVAWAGSHLLMAVVSPAIVLLALGIGGGLSTGDLGRVVLASVAYLPATWVLVGIAVLLFGLAPRIAVAVTWTALGLFLFVDLLAEFRVVTNATFLSPYVPVPDVLVRSSDSPFGLVWLTALAVGLVALGFAGWRRRDVG